MFFVVTTGRSGSTTMARVLNQHPLCVCRHEPHPILIKITQEWLHGSIDDEELFSYLAPHHAEHLFPHRIGLKMYGESDQKLSFLIPFLQQFGSATKFIWLVRDGRDVVASTYTRKEYSAEEEAAPPHVWAKYRIQGDACGDVEPDLWQTMTPFEKCCWYWSYTNRTIARDLAAMPNTQWMRVRLEELPQRLHEIRRFLDLPYYPLEIVHANRNAKPTHRYASWTDVEHDAFERWCGAEMDELYAGWRENSAEVPTPPSANSGKLPDAVHTAVSHGKWLLGKGVQKIKPSQLSVTTQTG